MAYSSGGLIEANDYNTLIGTSPGSTANKLNSVWAVGNGEYGYGQPAIAQVPGTSVVTATQWATVINSLNSINKHQTGAATSIVAPTSGSLIAYINALSSAITTVYSSHLSFTTQGTTQSGTASASRWTVANQAAAASTTITRTATFGSADAARYFFNAGGQMHFVVTSATNNDGTSRSSDMVTLAQTNFAGFAGFRAKSNFGLDGAGGTQGSLHSDKGYYNLTTSGYTMAQVVSTTSGYTSDSATMQVRSNGAQGVNGDTGTQVSFDLLLYSAARTPIPAPPANPPGSGTTVVNTILNDSIDVTVNTRLDIVYPEVANFVSNTWGAVTIS